MKSSLGKQKCSGGTATSRLAVNDVFLGRIERGRGLAYVVERDVDRASGAITTVATYDKTVKIDLGVLDVERTLSRRHARLIGRDGGFFLREEIGTANGTWVGGERIPAGVEHRLADRDRLRFGRLDFVFRLGGKA